MEKITNQDIMEGVDPLEKKYNTEVDPLELQIHGLFGERDTIGEAVEYFEDVVKAIPAEDRMPMYTAFYVFWNTIARNYTLTERNNNEL